MNGGRAEAGARRTSQLELAPVHLRRIGPGAVGRSTGSAPQLQECRCYDGSVLAKRARSAVVRLPVANGGTIHKFDDVERAVGLDSQPSRALMMPSQSSADRERSGLAGSSVPTAYTIQLSSVPGTVLRA